MYTEQQAQTVTVVPWTTEHLHPTHNDGSVCYDGCWCTRVHNWAL